MTPAPAVSGALLIYGASGYMGALTARTAVAAGLTPVLGGRRAEAVAPLAQELGLRTRVASLDDPAALAAALDGMDVVLNCAGPFPATTVPLAQACIRAGVHYLDLAGEVPEYEALLARDARRATPARCSCRASGSGSCRPTAWRCTSSAGCPTRPASSCPSRPSEA